MAARGGNSDDDSYGLSIRNYGHWQGQLIQTVKKLQLEQCDFGKNYIVK